jgi:hypothetical protein
MNLSTSSSSTGSQYLAADATLSSNLTSALTSSIQNKNTLAGDSALLRVETATAAKQKQTASAAPPTTNTSGYATVQNLMASLDNITINNGAALPSGVSSSQAANGYSNVQNLMSSLDSLTIGVNNSPAVAAAAASGQNTLASIDAIMATPTVNVKT